MSIFTRIDKASKALFGKAPMSYKEMAQKLDIAIKSGDVSTGPVEEKQRSSQLDIRKTDHDLGNYFVYSSLRDWIYNSQSSKKMIPARNNPERDFHLALMWPEEPILAGAVYSMTAKMAALKWSVTGKRLHATQTARMLSRAAHMGGWDWGGFISSVANDFYTVNRGVFIETAKDGDPTVAPMVDLGHIDALCCSLTGNTKFPVTYSSMESGQTLRFKPGEFIHYASLPSPRERDLGAGLCAVDRCYRAAMLLMGLHDYDDQKLDNLPPEGVAAVSGLTMDEFNDALKLWKAARESASSLTFPQVLWLIGSDPSAKVTLDLIGFSSLPESFDRGTVIEQYINTVALCFGVDAREFWSMAGGGLGSAGESEIQHLKAKGKGPGEFISTMERHINGELYDDTDFAFDTQDIEEDANSAALAKAWIDAYFPLYNLPPKQKDAPADAAVTKARGNPQPDKPNGQPSNPKAMLPNPKTGGQMSLGAGAAGGLGNSLAGAQGAGAAQRFQAEQVITKDEFLRLLADRGVIPDYLVTDERVVVEDTEIHNEAYKSYGHQNDVTKFVWENGILKEARVSLGSLWTVAQKPVYEPQLVDVNITDAVVEESSLDFDSVKNALDFLREKEQQIVADARNIRGEPIPDGEAVRGSAVNKKTLHDELERWRNDPILNKYALSVEEEQKLFGTYKQTAEISTTKSYPVEETQLIKITTPTDRVEMALKDLQNTVQQMALASSDNRANMAMERLLAVISDKQSNIKIEIPPITMMVPEVKLPVINITMPEQKQSQIEINMPEYKEQLVPNIIFSPNIDVPIPIVNVTVPPANVTVENNVPVPDVTVNNNIPVPEVKVDNVLNMPDDTGVETIEVHRGSDGKIKSMTKKG